MYDEKVRNIKNLIVLLLLTTVFLNVMDKTVFHYDGVSELNESLKVDNLKLMMPLNEVREILGKEEIKNEGLLWDHYKYPSKKIEISTSSPKSYDLYHKVSGITIWSNQYSIYGISIDTKKDEAFEILEAQGFTVKDIGGSFKIHRKGCISIFLFCKEDSIIKIDISIEDKYFNPDFITG